MTGDLAAWLTAQLDEIEQAARDATWAEWSAEGVWQDGTQQWHIGTPDQDSDRGRPLIMAALGPNGRADAAHIALHDPVFVLAWVAAFREVIRIYPRELGRIRPEYRSWVFLPSDNPDRIEQWSRDQEHDELLQLVRTWRMEDYLREVCFTPESPTLLALARPFRGRPGWRDEWDTGPGG